MGRADEVDALIADGWILPSERLTFLLGPRSRARRPYVPSEPERSEPETFGNEAERMRACIRRARSGAPAFDEFAVVVVDPNGRRLPPPPTRTERRSS